MEKHLEETGAGNKEPYVFESATIQVAVALHPVEQGKPGRLITISAWSHKDAPLVRCFFAGETTNLDEEINGLLEELKSTFPEREKIAIERHRLKIEADHKAAVDKKKAEETRAASAAAARKSPTAKKTESKPTVKAPDLAQLKTPAAAIKGGNTENQSSLFAEEEIQGVQNGRPDSESEPDSPDDTDTE